MQRVKVLKKDGFESERQLVEAILTKVRQSQRREYKVEQEVDAGVGVADIVLTKRTPKSADGLRALANVSPRLAILLSQDIGGSINTREELARCLGTSDASAKRVIAQLTKVGLAIHDRGSLHIATVNRLPFERLIAVEAKLKDWQGVLTQAYRNLQFADESWAVLDHAFIRPTIAQIERFKIAGVGLASIDRDRGLFVHHIACPRSPMSPAKRWQAQAVIASRVLSRRLISEAR